MIHKNTKKIVIEHYGADHQLAKAVEEQTELIHVIARRLQSKVWDTEAFYEELADVYAMLDQVKIIFGLENNISLENINNTLNKNHRNKMNRTQRRMQENSEWIRTEGACDKS